MSLFVLWIQLIEGPAPWHALRQIPQRPLPVGQAAAPSTEASLSEAGAPVLEATFLFFGGTSKYNSHTFLPTQLFPLLATGRCGFSSHRVSPFLTGSNFSESERPPSRPHPTASCVCDLDGCGQDWRRKHMKEPRSMLSLSEVLKG